ncbi:uncharacterized protein PV09_03327 [Verruconis gallopava]|uniref:Uncharacterized protein n=1 Tax=Verruconis gallopava TaxID=253628 RepID=A0A0D2AGX4_9PEZI|nr:uncharacterized protein PV09_03327 [Verruconis gallopava]KIW06168.1 hypothetical protein PV09_03327 [Verruconis gallopava]
MALNIAKSPLIGPVLALNGWTFVMELWLYRKRIPAINRAAEQGKLKIDASMTKADLDKALPPHVRWPADNFAHLHEQPTLFYATTLSLVLLGADNPLNIRLAWGYVGLRVLHSLVQASVNKIMLRFSLFVASSIVLAGMTARATQAFLA